jgi:hypothetical protein
MRQIDADRTRKGKGTRQSNHHGNTCKTESNRSSTTRPPSSSSSALEDNNHFLDNSSVDMSLYTTPSRATLSYPRGVHHLHDWQSHDSSVTPEVASVQSRLGGWEPPPPPPRTVAEDDKDNDIEGSRRSKRSSTSTRSATSSYTTGRRETSLCQRRDDTFFPETTSIEPSVQSQGPVDVDSMSFVEENFSEFLSTFEAQSLSDRMAPNSARTHHQRTNSKAIGNTTRQDDPSKRSKVRVGTLRGREYATTRQNERNGSRSVTRPSSIICSPHCSPNHIFNQADTYSSAEGLNLEFDDSRSLATEVSGLTMLTMEQQSLPVQSRRSESASPWRKLHRPQPPIVSKSPTRFSVPEDVSFSGLFSSCEDESVVGMLAPTTSNIKTPIERAVGNNIRQTFNLDRGLEKRSQQVEQGTFVEFRKGPRRSNLSHDEEIGYHTVSTSTSKQSTTKKSRGIEAERDHCKESPASSTSMASHCPEHSKESSTSEKRFTTCKKKDKGSYINIDKDGSRYFEIDSPQFEEFLDEASFSGLLSTIEAESLAGRLAATTPLRNLETPDSQSEVMSSTEKFACEVVVDIEHFPTNSDHQKPTPSISRRANVDEHDANPWTSTTLSDLADVSIVKATTKRSTVNSSFDKNIQDSNEVSVEVDETRFSTFLSVLEAQREKSNKLELPAATRLLPQDGSSIYVEDHSSVAHFSIITPHRDSPSMAKRDVCYLTTKKSRNEAENEPTETGTMEDRSDDSASVPSTLVEDDCSTDSFCSLTIDDQSTIPPPPLPEECSWNGNSLYSEGRMPLNMFASAGLTEIDAMSNVSSMEEYAGRRCVGSAKSVKNYGARGRLQCSTQGNDGPDIVSTGTEPISTPKCTLEQIRQDSVSIETSLQYSDSTAPGHVVTNMSSVAVSAENHRNLPKRKPFEGPIDLDESVAESNSDTASSWHSSASIDIPTQETPSKAPVTEHLQVQSPLSCDDEDYHHFVDDDDDVGDDDDHDDNDSSFSSLHNEAYVNEETVEHSYKETMESLSSARYESGSLLLTESELTKHVKSTQFKGSLPSSNLRGYDTWKRKQLATQGYFALVHEEAMKRKKKRDRLLEQNLQSSQIPNLPGRHRDFGVSAAVSAMEWSVSSTTQTSRTSEPIPRQRNDISLEPKRGWSFFRGNASKKAGTCPVSAVSSPPMKKCEPDVDHFFMDSEDNISLIPMNKLDPGTVTLTSSFSPRVALTAAKSHDSDDDRPRLLALQYLEMERARNREAEKDKTKLEMQEQNRIAIMKEREIERQRRLNAPRVSDSGQSIFSSKMTCNTQGSCTVQSLERNLSFGTTNTAQSSIKSPSCVLSPCILCNAAERSHVAQPCMHFYFCQDCANDIMSSDSPVCPICTAANVSFSRVYT